MSKDKASGNAEYYELSAKEIAGFIALGHFPEGYGDNIEAMIQAYASNQVKEACKEMKEDYEEQLQQAHDEIEALRSSADNYIDTLNTQIRGLRN